MNFVYNNGEFSRGNTPLSGGYDRSLFEGAASLGAMYRRVGVSFGMRARKGQKMGVFR